MTQGPVGLAGRPLVEIRITQACVAIQPGLKADRDGRARLDDYVNKVDRFVAIVGIEDAKIALARLASCESGIRHVEHSLLPRQRVRLLDAPSHFVRICHRIVAQFPAIASLVVVGHRDRCQMFSVENIAVIDIEEHGGIAACAVRAPCVAPFRRGAYPPQGHRASTGRVILLMQPELVIAPIRVQSRFCFAHGCPNTGSIRQSPAQVLVREAHEVMPVGLFDKFGVKRDVIRMLVQRIVEHPHIVVVRSVRLTLM